MAALIVQLMAKVLLFLLVYGMSASTDAGMVKDRARTKLLLPGIFCQFVILPLCGFASLNIFALGKTQGIILLVVTSSPGGSYSNWWCSLFNADLALSVAMTAASTLASVAMLPLNVLLYISTSYSDNVYDDINWSALFASISVVVSAVTLGLWTSHRLPGDVWTKWRGRFNALGNFAGISLIALSVILSSASAPIWNREAVFYAAVSLPCILGLGAALAVTSFLGLAKPVRMAVAIETCYQNVGLATSVALSMYDTKEEQSDAVGVPLFYGIVQLYGRLAMGSEYGGGGVDVGVSHVRHQRIGDIGVICLLMFSLACWRYDWTYAPSTESIWRVLRLDYQHKAHIGINRTIPCILEPSKLEETDETDDDPKSVLKIRCVNNEVVQRCSSKDALIHHDEIVRRAEERLKQESEEASRITHQTGILVRVRSALDVDGIVAHIEHPTDVDVSKEMCESERDV
eukprot:1189165-Prorocentrum_minimum.AAC.1